MTRIHDDLYADSVTMETTILQHFKGLTNPKKIVKLATKLALQTQNKLQKKLCLDIAYAADPVKYLNKCFAMLEDCSTIIAQFIADGCHGMLIDGKTTYPVRVEALSSWLRKEDKWTEADEIDIQYQAAENWLIEYEKSYFLGKVVLFSEFGFSGVPRLIEVSLDQKAQQAS